LGRVKNVRIKLIARELLERFPDRFSKDFYKNKTALKDLVTIESKKMKNQIAGYLSRLVIKKEVLKTTKVSYQRIIKKGTRRRSGRKRR